MAKCGRRHDVPTEYLGNLFHTVAYVVVLLVYLVPGLLTVGVNTLTQQKREYQFPFLIWSSQLIHNPAKRRSDGNDDFRPVLRMFLGLMTEETESLLPRDIIIVVVAEQCKVVKVAAIAEILTQKHAYALPDQF